MDEPRDLLFHEWPMFNQVMTNEHDICRRLLEVVLGEPVDRVRNVEVERTVEPRLGAKGVRLDAFASTANAVYDVEIQAYTMKELGRRMRYYLRWTRRLFDGASLTGILLRVTSYSSALRISSTRRFPCIISKWFAARMRRSIFVMGSIGWCSMLRLGRPWQKGLYAVC